MGSQEREDKEQRIKWKRGNEKREEEEEEEGRLG